VLRTVLAVAASAPNRLLDVVKVTMPVEMWVHT
jgi:hypothetical protein